jgi:hypothetical protein
VRFWETDQIPKASEPITRNRFWNKLMKSLIIFCLTASSAFCQLFSVGVKAGVPLGDAYSSIPNNISEARRYLLGPTVEVHLHLRFSVQLDAIDKRSGLDGTPSVLPALETATDSVRAKINGSFHSSASMS